MRVVKPLVVVETPIPGHGTPWMQKLEYYVRKCYKSEDKITDESYDQFIRRVFRTMKHEGVIEHFSVTVTMITDRGVSHEHVRHRMATYLQESTRYCDYGTKGVTFILPAWVTPQSQIWPEYLYRCREAELTYQWFRENQGWKPQEARYWLPNGIKTEYVATHNLGSWYNFIRKRTPANVHPQMRQLAIPLLRYFRENLPIIFDGFDIPEFQYEEAKLILHPGCEPVEFEEVNTLPPGVFKKLG